MKIIKKSYYLPDELWLLIKEYLLYNKIIYNKIFTYKLKIYHNNLTLVELIKQQKKNKYQKIIY